MSTKVDFLQPDIDQIRHQIRGILDSYSHDWDILAELAQNAVDALRRKPPTRGHIRLMVDAVNRTIEFSDNGCGIEPDKLQGLLRPFATDKSGLANQIGQKGVGLTFILFSSSSFELETHSSSGSRQATILDARSWVESRASEALLVELGNPQPQPSGVRVRITFSDPDHPLTKLTFKQILFALRTRTALGSTGFIWGDALNCDVDFAHIDRAGARNEVEFDCKYMLPTENLKTEDYISVQDYLDWRASTDRSDSDKRRRLQSKIVTTSGKRYQAGENSSIGRVLSQIEAYGVNCRR